MPNLFVDLLAAIGAKLGVLGQPTDGPLRWSGKVILLPTRKRIVIGQRGIGVRHFSLERKGLPASAVTKKRHTRVVEEISPVYTARVYGRSHLESLG